MNLDAQLVPQCLLSLREALRRKGAKEILGVVKYSKGQSLLLSIVNSRGGGFGSTVGA